MSINRHHGGAIEDCARQLKKIADRAASESISMDEAATRTLAAMKEAGERMPGFGHRYHTKDPRTARLFELAREAGVDGAHMKAARAVEKSFADAKKALPINVDGAIGAILADLGMNPAAFNGIFMIARTPGLVAHVIEEQTREKPMRRIDPVKHGYDGPPPRSISGGSIDPSRQALLQIPMKRRTRMKEEKILTKHPLGKRGVNISKEKYETLKKAILAALGKKELTHTELFDRLNKSLKGKFSGSISWYAETVKLDLEARKMIQRTFGKTPKIPAEMSTMILGWIELSELDVEIQSRTAAQLDRSAILL